jgi:hypothetical protein
LRLAAQAMSSSRASVLGVRTKMATRPCRHQSTHRSLRSLATGRMGRTVTAPARPELPGLMGTAARLAPGAAIPNTDWRPVWRLTGALVCVLAASSVRPVAGRYVDVAMTGFAHALPLLAVLAGQAAAWRGCSPAACPATVSMP